MDRKVSVKLAVEIDRRMDIDLRIEVEIAQGLITRTSPLLAVKRLREADVPKAVIDRVLANRPLLSTWKCA